MPKEERYRANFGEVSVQVFRDYSATGSPAEVKRFCDALLKSPPPGWTATSRHESFVSGTYYNFFRPSSAELPAATVALYVKDGSANTAEVVNIVPDKEHELGIDRYNAILDEFVRFADPVANAHGLTTEATSSNADITKWISGEAARRLRSFSSLANKSTGSGHPMDFERWTAFIIQVHRDKRRLGTDILGRYLVEVLGWDEKHAHDLVLEFEFGLALLEQYDNSGS